jgi:hypothetical protein
MSAEYTWKIPNAIYMMRKHGFRHGKYLKSMPFTLHGKTWVARFSPIDGDFSLYLILGEAHVSRLQVEMNNIVKFSTNSSLFTIGLPVGFSNCFNIEEREQGINENGCWILKIVVLDN